MIVKLREAGDHATVAILELILREEVAHVAAGSRWFRWCCERRGVEARATFRALLREHASGVLARQSVVEGKRIAVSVYLGGRRIIKNKTISTHKNNNLK